MNQHTSVFLLRVFRINKNKTFLQKHNRNGYLSANRHVFDPYETEIRD